MSVKILLLFVCAAIGTLCGYLIMKKYKRRAEYLDGLCGLIDALSRNVSYRRDSAVKAISAIETGSTLLKKHIAEYGDYAVGKVAAPDISKGFLDDGTYDKVREFFGSIGSFDGATQINELKMYTELFGGLRAEADEKYGKYGAFSVKIGFLIGLLIGVLVL